MPVFFFNFKFERSYDVLKSKSPCTLLKKNINFAKNETESKMEIPKSHIQFQRDEPCASAHLKIANQK